jgi:glycosyltransferase involved in cell wall biosynthesis
MKISLWYKIIDEPWGGANSFIKALANQLAKRGNQIFFQPKNFVDIILINSWMYAPGKTLSVKKVSKIKKYGRIASFGTIFPFINTSLAHEKSKSPPIIHRLDGIASLYGRNDKSDEIQFNINRLTDYTIFQSEYSKQCFSKFNIRPLNSSVIHNGVNNNIFYPQKMTSELGSTLKALAVSWSNNPRKGFHKLAELAEIQNIEVYFIGHWCKSVRQGKVKNFGIRSTKEIAEIMRQSDIFLHPSENDNCPNVVLEALASGLPILFTQSGGTTELVKDYGIPLYNDLKRSIEEIRNSYHELRARIFENLHLFSIEYAADQYLKIFEEVRRRF